MAGQELELALKIKSAVEGLDEIAKLAKEIETLGGDATAVREKAAALAGEFDKLSQQQALIDQFTHLSGAAKTADQALAQAQANTRDLALQFKQSQSNIEAVENALKNARQSLSGAFSPSEIKALNAEIKVLETELKAAQKDSAALETRFESSRKTTREWADAAQAQRLELQKTGQAMNEAGLDAQKLEVSQARVTLGMKDARQSAQALEEELKALRTEAEAAARIDMARGLLDVKPPRDMRQEIEKVRDAFDTLANSGRLSDDELAQAALNAAAKIKALGGEAKGLSAEFDRLEQAQQDALNLRALDLKPFRDMGAEIQQIRDAFDRLKASGTLSEEQLAQAAQAAATKIDALGGDVRGLSAEFDRLRAEQQQAFDFKALNLAPLRDTGAEIQKVRDALDRLRASGNLTGDQLAQATQAAERRIAELDGSAQRAADAMRMFKATSEPVVTTFDKLGSSWQSAATRLAGTGDAARKAGKDIADAGDKGATGLFKLKPLVKEIQQELAGLAVGAGLAEFVKGTVNAARQAEMAFLGLQGVAKNTGLDIGTTFNAAGRQAADGLITLTESSKALQNLLLSGFGIDQAVALMGRLKDAASLNRSASMSLGEAVVSVTEGFRTESSELLNNGGIVTNLSAMYEAHAKTLGKSADGLTQAEKAQALFNGVMKDTAPYVGNAEKAAGGLEGALSKLKANVSELQIAFGGDLGPAVQFIAGLLGGLVDIAKRVGVGFNLAGLESAALAKSIGDVYAAVKSGNLDGLGDKIKANFTLAHEMAIEAVDRYERGLTPAIQQATDKTQTMGAAGQKAGADVAGGQQQAQTALGETGQAAETVEKKLAKVFEGFKPNASAEELKTFIAKVNEAGGQGADAGDKVRESWQKAISTLSGPALVGFVQSMDVALTNLKLGFQGDSEEAQRLAHLVDTGVRQAITKMGLDANQSLTGVSGKVREGLDDFLAMQQILVSTGAAGDKAGTILVSALQKVADQAQSTDDIDAIRKQAVALGVDGKKAGDIVAQALQRIAGEAKTAEDIDRVRKMAVALGADGSASAQQLIGVYDALQKATEKVGGAEAGAAKALADSRAEISRLASELTATEKAQSAASIAADRQAQAVNAATAAVDKHGNAIEQDGAASARWYDVMEMATNRIGELNPYLREQVILFQSGTVDAYALEGAFHLIHTTLNRLEADKATVDGLAASISAAANSGGDMAVALRDAGFSLEGTGNTADEVRMRFRDLDQVHLNGLISAVESARQAIASFRDSAKSDLGGVLDQLDQINGNELGIEQRRYETQKSDFEGKLALAQQMGDVESAATYREALQKLDELHAANQKRLSKKATGGPVRKDEEVYIGEEGPETFEGDDGSVTVVGTDGPGVFRPPVDGRIVPNHKMRAATDPLPPSQAEAQPDTPHAPERAISGKREQGGSVNAWEYYLIGEKGVELFVGKDGTEKWVGNSGPEVFQPGVDGYVFPNSVIPGSGGAGNAEWWKLISTLEDQRFLLENHQKTKNNYGKMSEQGQQAWDAQQDKYQQSIMDILANAARAAGVYGAQIPSLSKADAMAKISGFEQEKIHAELERQRASQASPASAADTQEPQNQTVRSPGGVGAQYQDENGYVHVNMGDSRQIIYDPHTGKKITLDVDYNANTSYDPAYLADLFAQKSSGTNNPAASATTAANTSSASNANALLSGLQNQTSAFPTAPTPSGQVSPAQAQATQTIRLELVLPGGRTAYAGMDRTNADALLNSIRLGAYTS